MLHKQECVTKLQHNAMLLFLIQMQFFVVISLPWEQYNISYMKINNENND